MVIDISQEIFSCNVYPGDPAPTREQLCDMNKGELYNLSAFSMCAHNGTHVDAPAHFIKDGKTMEELDAEIFVGACYVERFEGDVTSEEAQRIMKKARDAGAPERILIAGKATVTAEAARVFAAEKIKLIGNESQTVGPEHAPMEVHKILLGAEVVLLEGVVLKNVECGKYLLFAAPLNLAGCEGAPCRAVLVK